MVGLLSRNAPIDEVLAALLHGSAKGGLASVADMNIPYTRAMQQALDHAHGKLFDKLQTSPYEWAGGVAPRKPFDMGTSKNRRAVFVDDAPNNERRHFAHSHPGVFASPELGAALPSPLSVKDLTVALKQGKEGISAVDTFGGVHLARVRPGEETLRMQSALASGDDVLGKGMDAAYGSLGGQADIYFPNQIFDKADKGAPAGMHMNDMVGGPMGLALALKRMGILDDVALRTGDPGQARPVRASRNHIVHASNAAEDRMRQILGLLAALGAVGPAAIDAGAPQEEPLNAGA